MTRTELALILNLLLIFIICSVLMGAFYIQFVEHETPCPLCMLQRAGMVGVALGALLNLRFGISPAHYALSLLSCLTGGLVALRQISLHVCPQFPTFGIPVLGLSLYTWSFLVFVSSEAGMREKVSVIIEGEGDSLSVVLGIKLYDDGTWIEIGNGRVHPFPIAFLEKDSRDNPSHS